MYDQALLHKIREYSTRKINPIPTKVLSENNFTSDPRNNDLLELWKNSSRKEWNWQQVVRFALDEEHAQQHMYDKLVSLLREHRGHYSDYFEIDTEEGSFPTPNPLTELNRFEALYDEFFVIYNNIINQIHFESPKKEIHGPRFRGKINWQKTIFRSNTQHPINFVSEIPIRRFVNPGNMLLVLSILWMHKQANRILEIPFSEPLSDKKKYILQSVNEKTRNLLEVFPFQDVVKESNKYWDFKNDDPLIITLEHKLKKEINEKTIQNKNYQKLLEWIEKFRNLNLSMVSKNTPVKNLLKSKEAQDTVYEAWMFMEFYDYVSKIGWSPKLTFGKIDGIQSKANFEFEHNGQKIVFWYERDFLPSGPHVWALQQTPDFTVMVDDKVIGVFDAKNYSTSNISDPIRKMLTYMSNLNCDFGVLFFPYLPEFWEEWGGKSKNQKSKRRNLLTPHYSKKYPDKTIEEIQVIDMPELKKEWDDLSQEIKNTIQINPIEQLVNPERPEMEFLHMRMEPSNSEIALEMKRMTIESLFNKIRKKIPITISQ
jgi:hypothetical protein